MLNKLRRTYSNFHSKILNPANAQLMIGYLNTALHLTNRQLTDSSYSANNLAAEQLQQFLRE